ncbi:hypothetical protein NFI96_001359, partial [Prochilodus magdalenae]
MALKKLGQILKEHPWRSYVVANLAVILLEKLVEQDFVCPCRRDLAWAIFFLYLMMPLLIGINFGIYLWKSNLWSDLGTDSKTTESQAVCKCSCKCCAIFLTCLFPPVFWLVLFFGDGKYVACLITPLEEDYVDGSNKSSWEWCDKDRARTDKQNYAIYASKHCFASALTNAVADTVADAGAKAVTDAVMNAVTDAVSDAVAGVDFVRHTVTNIGPA